MPKISIEWLVNLAPWAMSHFCLPSAAMFRTEIGLNLIPKVLICIAPIHQPAIVANPLVLKEFV